MKHLFSALALVILTVQAKACATCAGGDNAQLAEASNSVLWILLALVAFIFLATGATIFFLWRKSTTTAAPGLPLTQTLNPADAAD